MHQCVGTSVLLPPSSSREIYLVSTYRSKLQATFSNLGAWSTFTRYWEAPASTSGYPDVRVVLFGNEGRRYLLRVRSELDGTVVGFLSTRDRSKDIMRLISVQKVG